MELRRSLDQMLATCRNQPQGVSKRGKCESAIKKGSSVPRGSEGSTRIEPQEKVSLELAFKSSANGIDEMTTCMIKAH